MADEKDKKGATGTGRVSRTHPVLGDSSPEARASRMKTEAVPASMVNQLRDQLIAGVRHPVKPKAAPNETASDEPKDTPIQPQSAPLQTPERSEPLKTAPQSIPDVQSVPDVLQQKSDEPSERDITKNALLEQQDSFFHEASEPGYRTELERESSSELTSTKSGPVIDRRKAQQGRETLRQLREARLKRDGVKTSGKVPSSHPARTRTLSPRSRRIAILGLGIGGGIALVFALQLGRPSLPASTKSPAPTNTTSPNPLQLLPGSIFEPVTGTISFPRLPTGLYTGLARGIVPGSDVSLTFISRGDGASIGVILGIEGWQSAVVTAIGEEPFITASSNGWLIRFIAKKTDDQLIVGRWENITTKEVGEWKVVPMR
jgi:hypothetical protein